MFSYDGDSYLKVFLGDDKGMRLVSINKKYKPIKITDPDRFYVLGKVVGKSEF